MNLLVYFLVMTLLFGALFCWGLVERIRELERENASLDKRRQSNFNSHMRASCERDAAMEQIAALERQTAGRDKTGRFTKRPKESEVHGSE